jgi:hypothetical protein
MTDLFQDAGFTFSPDGPLLGPTGSDIDAIHGKDKQAGYRVSAMGHGIRF